MLFKHRHIFVLKRSYSAFGLFLSFIVLQNIFVPVKVLQSEKVQRDFLLCLEHVVCSRAFTSVIYVHHHVTGIT